MRRRPQKPSISRQEKLQHGGSLDDVVDLEALEAVDSYANDDDDDSTALAAGMFAQARCGGPRSGRLVHISVQVLAE